MRYQSCEDFFVTGVGGITKYDEDEEKQQFSSYTEEDQNFCAKEDPTVEEEEQNHQRGRPHPL